MLASPKRSCEDFVPGNGGIKIRGMTLMTLHIFPDC
jgi:hypothetical protein